MDSVLTVKDMAYMLNMNARNLKMQIYEVNACGAEILDNLRRIRDLSYMMQCKIVKEEKDEKKEHNGQDHDIPAESSQQGACANE